jgi:dienelactone hydrolase
MRFRVADIAAIGVYDASVAGRRPIVLLLHGSGSTKESGLPAAETLASLGYYSVVFDAFGFGESPHVGRFLTSPMDIFQIYRETSGYINRLIRYLAQTPEADATRVGLIGFSMGAHTIYHYLAYEAADVVRAAVPVCGSPRWDGIARRFILTFEQFARLRGEETMRSYEERVASFHPLHRLASAGSKAALLALAGERDELIPADDLREFYGRLQQVSAHPGRHRLIVYPDAGHVVAPEMLAAGFEWLGRHLRQLPSDM